MGRCLCGPNSYMLGGLSGHYGTAVLILLFNSFYSPAVGSILVPEDREVSDEMVLKIRPLGRSQDLRSYVVVHEEV